MPWLKGIASVTLFAFTFTSILPSGYAAPPRPVEKETLRVGQPESPQTLAGIEEGLRAGSVQAGTEGTEPNSTGRGRLGAKTWGIIALALFGLVGGFVEMRMKAPGPAEPPVPVKPDPSSKKPGTSSKKPETSPTVAKKDEKITLAGLRAKLGPDRQIGIIVWDPSPLLEKKQEEFFQDVVRARIDTVWVSGFKFSQLTPPQRQKIVDRASEADLKTLGFIDGDPAWPGEPAFVANHYRELNGVIAGLNWRKVKTAVAADVEPHVNPKWDGSMEPSMRLVEETILPNVKGNVTLFHTWWLKNGVTTTGGAVVKGERAIPRTREARMTYGGTPEAIFRMSRAGWEKAKESKAPLLIGVETLAGQGVPVVDPEKIGPVLERTFDLITEDDPGNKDSFGGVFIHTEGVGHASREVIPALLGKPPFKEELLKVTPAPKFKIRDGKTARFTSTEITLDLSFSDKELTGERWVGVIATKIKGDLTYLQPFGDQRALFPVSLRAIGESNAQVTFKTVPERPFKGERVGLVTVVLFPESKAKQVLAAYGSAPMRSAMQAAIDAAGPNYRLLEIERDGAVTWRNKAGVEEQPQGQSQDQAFWTRRQLLAAGAATAAAAAVAGVPGAASAQAPAPAVPARGGTAALQVANGLPYRQILARPNETRAPGPPTTAHLDITTPAAPAAPLSRATKQTPVSRRLATGSNFLRHPPAAARSRLVQLIYRIREFFRRLFFGSPKPETWAASQAPGRSGLFTGVSTHYTLWDGNRWENLDSDYRDAILDSLQAGAQKAGGGAQASIFYDTAWPVTLQDAQGEESPVDLAVLKKVSAQVAQANRRGIAVHPLYSGYEALWDPDDAVLHLNNAIYQGFNLGKVATDVEFWAIPPGQPGGEWATALADMHSAWLRLRQAAESGDAETQQTARRHLSEARQRLFKPAISWMRIHENILQRVIPGKRARFDTQGSPSQLYAHILPAAVPILRVALLWNKVEAKAGSDGAKAWDIFDEVTTRVDWDTEQLKEALNAAGFQFEDSDLQARLPDRMKLVVMAYAYPDGREAEEVAEAMRMAHAGGFGGQMGLAVNLEPSLLKNETLADRSARLDEIAQEIMDKLSDDPSTGFDGTTLSVHIADELGWMDMVRNGRLSAKREVTPKRVAAVMDQFETSFRAASGIPPRPVSDKRRPEPQSSREFWERQVGALGQGMFTGIPGIAPYYAFLVDNPHLMIRLNLSAVNPDTIPAGPEFGGGQRATKLLLGALGSAQAGVTELTLVLTRVDGQGNRHVLEVPNIMGANSPIITDGTWTEAKLVGKVKRTTPVADLGMVVDVAATVENRYASPSRTPRERWEAVIIDPIQVALRSGSTETGFEIELPPLVRGTNIISLILRNNKGEIIEWIGPGQNTGYLARSAAYVADTAAAELKKAQQAAKKLDVLGLNAVEVETGGRAELMTSMDVNDKTDVEQTAGQLAAFKSEGGTAISLRIPYLLDEAEAALVLSDNRQHPFVQGHLIGRDPGTQRNRSKLREVMPRMKELIARAHQAGLKVYLALDAAGLVVTATRRWELEQRSTRPVELRRPNREAFVSDLIRLIIQANADEEWQLDGLALIQNAPEEERRTLLDRIVREGLEVGLVVVGPSGVSTGRSLYSQQVDLSRGNPEALRQVKQITGSQPFRPPEMTREHRYHRSVFLPGTLVEAVAWLRSQGTVATDEEVRETFLKRLRVPDRNTLVQLGYPAHVADETLAKAETVSQKSLNEALDAGREGKVPPRWAVAWVDGIAPQLKEVTECPQVERYGTRFDQAVLWAWGIRVSPLIVTEAQRAEVRPLVDMHQYLEDLNGDGRPDGEVILGVEITNPVSPRHVSQPPTPTIYDVEVHLDYPSWTSRRDAIHEVYTVILEPGEKAPFFVKITGLPVGESSRLVRIRVIPRGSEQHLPGQIGTRSPDEQVLEQASFVFRGYPRSQEKNLGQNLQEELVAFHLRERSRRRVYGLKPDAPNAGAEEDYENHFEDEFKGYFGVGTPHQRVKTYVIRENPQDGSLAASATHYLPNESNPAQVARREMAQAETERKEWDKKVGVQHYAQIQQEPENWGTRFLTGVYTTAGLAAPIWAAYSYLTGYVKDVRRAADARRLSRQIERENRERRAGNGLSQTVSASAAKSIRIEGGGGNFVPHDASTDPEQGKVPRALAAYGKNEVIAVDPAVADASRAIEQTPVEQPVGKAATGVSMTPEQRAAVDRATFQRAAPRLLGWNILGLVAGIVGIFTAGVPVLWVGTAVLLSMVFWSSARTSPVLQQRVGYLLNGPQRVAESPVTNGALAVSLVSLAVIAGVALISLSSGFPLWGVAAVAAIWLVPAAVGIRQFELHRVLGVAAIAGLGSLALIGLLGGAIGAFSYLQMGVWIAATMATFMLIRSFIRVWLTADRPVEGLYLRVTSLTKFLLKWGVFLGAIWAAIVILHPFIWTGAGVWVGLKGLMAFPVLAQPGAAVWVLLAPLIVNLLFHAGLMARQAREGQASGADWLRTVLLGLAVPAAISWVAVTVMGGAVLTAGVAVVAALLSFNLLLQGIFFRNGIIEEGTTRRDWYSFFAGGLIPFLGFAGFSAIWGAPAVAAVIVYVALVLVTMLVISSVLIWKAVLAEEFQARLEHLDRVSRVSPEQVDLQRDNWSDADRALYAQARRQAASSESDFIRRRWGVAVFSADVPAGSRVAEDLNKEQRMLVNRVYFRLSARQQAERQPDFSGLSLNDQQRLINLYFSEYLKAHTDVMLGEDAGTTMRTFWSGVLSGRLSSVVGMIRRSDRINVVMPALFLSLAFSWGPGRSSAQAQRELRRQPYRLLWETFRMALVSFAVPLGFAASMGNRFFSGIMGGKNVNIVNPVSVRGDAGLGGYTDPLGYVIEVMGRWLVGHIYDLMRAYLGRRVTFQLARLIHNSRWAAKPEAQLGLTQWVDHLFGEAEQAWQAGDRPLFRRLMAAAHYATLAGDRNLYFDVGKNESAVSFEEEIWNQQPDEDGLFDDSYYGPEFNEGVLSGLLAHRYDVTAGAARRFGVATYSGVRVYYPTKVELVLKHSDPSGRLELDLLSDQQTARLRIGDSYFTVVRFTAAEQQHWDSLVQTHREAGVARQVLAQELSEAQGRRERFAEQRFLLFEGMERLENQGDEIPAEIRTRLADLDRQDQAAQAIANRNDAILRKVVELPSGDWFYYGVNQVELAGNRLQPGPAFTPNSEFSLVEQFSPNPGKFRVQGPGSNPKSRLGDMFLQYAQGRYAAEPVVQAAPTAAGTEEGRPTHRLNLPFTRLEDRFFPQLRAAREAVENPKNRFEGARRQRGVAAAEDVARRRDERIRGGSGEVTRVFQGDLGHDGYNSNSGKWYQFRLNIFRWLKDRFQGRDSNGHVGRWQGWVWWTGAVLIFLSSMVFLKSLTLGFAAVFVPWIMAHLYGTLFPLSFPGLGVQDSILQGMKGHYNGEFLENSIREFFRFRGSPVAQPLPEETGAAEYDRLLEQGASLIESDGVLSQLAELYPYLMQPEHWLYSRIPFLSRVIKADPVLTRAARRILGDPSVPGSRRALRLRVRQEILLRMARVAENDPGRWRALREAFTRNVQGELMVVGNEVAGIQYHRSRNPDVFRGGDENAQFATDGQDPLMLMMTGLGVPAVGTRSWARISVGAFYGASRMPSMVYDREEAPGTPLGQVLSRASRTGILLEAVGQDSGGVVKALVRYEGPLDGWDAFRGNAAGKLGVKKENVTLIRLGERGRERTRQWMREQDIAEENVSRRISPVRSYLAQKRQGQTANQYFLERTHLQPDLEAVNEFFLEESRDHLRDWNVEQLTVEAVDRYLERKEERLGLKRGSFVRLGSGGLRWSDEQLRRRATAVRQKIQSQNGAVRLGGVDPPLSAGVGRFLSWARWWLVAGTLIGGFFFAPLWIGSILIAALGAQASETFLTSFFGKIGYFLAQLLRGRIARASRVLSDPYSEEVILLSLLHGAAPRQLVRSPLGEVIDLNWSSLDGNYDASRWTVVLGTYLFPGSTKGRVSIGEKQGEKVHAPDLPYDSALISFEEPPWLASAGGFSAWVRSDVYEAGESFAEDTLFALVNLQGGSKDLSEVADLGNSLNPSFNAMQVQQKEYVLGQQELRKLDEGPVRAVELFKGIGIHQAMDHLFDHPLFGTASRPGAAQDQAEFRDLMFRVTGMEAFRRDEMAAAGAHGAGSLPYGYTGFTVLDLFGRRVGPFAPGTIYAFWEAEIYAELNRRMGNAFADALDREQVYRGRDLAPRSGWDGTRFLQGLLADPFVVLAEAEVRAQEAARLAPPTTTGSEETSWISRTAWAAVTGILLGITGLFSPAAATAGQPSPGPATGWAKPDVNRTLLKAPDYLLENKEGVAVRTDSEKGLTWAEGKIFRDDQVVTVAGYYASNGNFGALVTPEGETVALLNGQGALLGIASAPSLKADPAAVDALKEVLSPTAKGLAKAAPDRNTEPGEAKGSGGPPPLEENLKQIREVQKKILEAESQKGPAQAQYNQTRARKAEALLPKGGISGEEYRQSMLMLGQVKGLEAEETLLKLHADWIKAVKAKDKKEADRLAGEIRAKVDPRLRAREETAQAQLENLRYKLRQAETLVRQDAGSRTELRKARENFEIGQFELQQYRLLREIRETFSRIGPHLPLVDGLSEGSLLGPLKAMPGPPPPEEGPARTPEQKREDFRQLLGQIQTLLGVRISVVDKEIGSIRADNDSMERRLQLNTVGRAERDATVHLGNAQIGILEAEQARVRAQQQVLEAMKPSTPAELAAQTAGLALPANPLLKATQAMVLDLGEDPSLRRERLAEALHNLAQTSLAHFSTLGDIEKAKVDELKANLDRENRLLRASATSRESVRRAELALSVARTELEQKQNEIRQRELSVKVLGLSQANAGSPRLADLEGTLTAILGSGGVAPSPPDPKGFVQPVPLGRPGLTPEKAQAAAKKVLDYQSENHSSQARKAEIDATATRFTIDQVQRLSNQTFTYGGKTIRGGTISGEEAEWAAQVLPLQEALSKAEARLQRAEEGLIKAGDDPQKFPAAWKERDAAADAGWKALQDLANARWDVLNGRLTRFRGNRDILSGEEQNRLELDVGLLTSEQRRLSFQLELDRLLFQRLRFDNQEAASRGEPGRPSAGISSPWYKPSTAAPEAQGLKRKLEGRTSPAGKLLGTAQTLNGGSISITSVGQMPLTSITFVGSNRGGGTRVDPNPADSPTGWPALGEWPAHVFADFGPDLGYREGLVARQGPILNVQMDPDNYEVIAIRGTYTIGGWPMVVNLKAEPVDEKGRAQKGLIVYPLYQMVPEGNEWVQKIVGGVVQEVPREKFFQTIDDIDKRKAGPIAPLGFDKDGHPVLGVFYPLGSLLPWTFSGDEGTRTLLRLQKGTTPDEPLNFPVEKTDLIFPKDKEKPKKPPKNEGTVPPAKTSSNTKVAVSDEVDGTGDRIPPWVWWAGGGLLVLAGGILVWRGGRGPSGPTTPVPPSPEPPPAPEPLPVPPVPAPPVPEPEVRSFQVESAHDTQLGKRENNEDYRLVRELRDAEGNLLATVAVVNDGMGGQAKGEVASQKAAERIILELSSPEFTNTVAGLNGSRGDDEAKLAGAVEAAVSNAIQAAHQELFDLQAGDPSSRGMGTTTAVIVIAARKAVVATVGDTRARRLRGGNLQQLTVDDNIAFVLAQIAKGLVAEEALTDEQITEIGEGALDQRGGSVLSAHLGQLKYEEGQPVIESVTPHTRVLTLEAGDQFLLSTDGLTAKPVRISNSKLQETLLLAGSPTDAVRSLMEQAAPSSDNSTVFLAKIGLPAEPVVQEPVVSPPVVGEPPAPEAASPSPTQEDIRARAYAIWEREGRPEGQSERHWRQAEEELQKSQAVSESVVQQPAEPAAPTPSAQPAAVQTLEQQRDEAFQAWMDATQRLEEAGSSLNGSEDHDNPQWQAYIALDGEVKKLEGTVGTLELEIQRRSAAEAYLRAFSEQYLGAGANLESAAVAQYPVAAVTPAVAEEHLFLRGLVGRPMRTDSGALVIVPEETEDRDSLLAGWQGRPVAISAFRYAGREDPVMDGFISQASGRGFAVTPLELGTGLTATDLLRQILRNLLGQGLAEEIPEQDLIELEQALAVLA